MSPGDAVVCVNTDAPCPCGEQLGIDGIPPPKVGRHYRVAYTSDGYCEQCGTIVPAMRAEGTDLPGHYVWPQSCFRRLEPASEDIFLLTTTTPELEPA